MNMSRCRISLAGTAGEPCQAPAGHEGRGHDLSGQPWSHAYVPAPDHAFTETTGRCSCGWVTLASPLRRNAALQAHINAASRKI